MPSRKIGVRLSRPWTANLGGGKMTEPWRTGCGLAVPRPRRAKMTERKSPGARGAALPPPGLVKRECTGKTRLPHAWKNMPFRFPLASPGTGGCACRVLASPRGPRMRRPLDPSQVEPWGMVCYFIIQLLLVFDYLRIFQGL